MKTMVKLSGAFVVLMFAVLGLAGTPPHEVGLSSGTQPLLDTQQLPRALAITDGGLLACNVDLLNGPRNPAQFQIPISNGGVAAISIQCPDAGAWAYTDVLTVAPGTGVKIEAGGFWSTAVSRSLRPQQFDGGYYTGGMVCISPLAGASAAQCIVHGLQGTF